MSKGVEGRFANGKPVTRRAPFQISLTMVAFATTFSLAFMPTFRLGPLRVLRSPTQYTLRVWPFTLSVQIVKEDIPNA